MPGLAVSVIAGAGAGLLLSTVPSNLAVLATLATLASLAVIAKPAIGLYGVVLTAPLHLYRIEVGIGNLSLFRLLLILSAVSVGLHLLASPWRRKQMQHPGRLALFALLAAAFLLFEWIDPSRLTTPLGNTLFLNYAAFFFSVGLLVASIELGFVRRRTVIVVAMWSALIPLALVLQQYLGARGGQLPQLPFVDAITSVGPNADRSGVAFEDTFRLAGPFSDPNFLGIFCGVTFGIAGLERPWIASPKGRWALDALRIACLLGVFASLSRTGAVIVFLFLLASLISRPGRSARIGRMTLLVGIPLVIVAASGLVPNSTMTTLQNRIEDPASTATHRETQSIAFELGQAHPALGIGLGELGPALGEPPDRSSAHGLPYTFFAEGGLLGLGLVAIALGYPLLVGMRERTGPARGALVLALIVTLFLYDYLFILDVAAVWWAVVMARDDRGRRSSSPCRGWSFEV